MAAVGAWPVLQTPYGRRGGRGKSNADRMATVAAEPVPGPRMTAVVAGRVP